VTPEDDDIERWKRIEDLYGTALACAPEERTAFLHAHCSDADLRREVDSLLQADRLAGRFLTSEQLAEHINELAAGAHPTLAGRSLAHYADLSPIGSGATGEVYRAHDARLGRAVALKVLHPQFTDDPASLSRFVREARAASALNHPNILIVYEVGQVDGTHFIATELIEGASLRARLAAGRLEVLEALDVAIQCAAALEAGHRAGIVHRDVKPENVMIRPDGLVKMVDFGLARAPVDAYGDAVAARTLPGIIMGTPRYMSPEQARGEPLDARTDIFSLGAVLYEMLVGQPCFPGASTAEVFAALLTVDTRVADTGLERLPADIKPILRKALEKDRARRYQTIGELGQDLRALLVARLQQAPSARPGTEVLAHRLLATHHAPGGVPTTAWQRARMWSRSRVAIASVALAATLGGAIFWGTRGKAPDRPAPVYIEGLPLTGAPGNETTPAFSPDGRQIAYAWDGGGPPGEQSIYVRLVDGGNPLRLTSGAHDSTPVWSPEASRIAFLRYSPAGVQVLLVPALGGAHTLVGTITDVQILQRRLLTWSPVADELIVADNTGSPKEGLRRSLFALRISSGERRRLTSPPEGMDDIEPAFSPDGRTLAFLRKHGAAYQFHVIDTPGGASRQLAREDNVEGFAWSSDSRSLVFFTTAAPPRRVQVVPVAGGAPVPAQFQLGSGVRDLVLSPSGGRIAFVHEQKDRNIWALNHTDGVFRPLITSTRSDEDPRISPDTSKIAFTSNRAGAYEVWVSERDGSNPRPVTSHRIFAGSPSWSPDSRTLAYDVAVDGPTAIWLVNAAGGPSRRLLKPPSPGFIPNWSADGAWLYYAAWQQIWKSRPDGSQSRQVTRQGGFEGFETFDGQYFYFTKDLGTPGIWRVPAAGGDEELLPELASVLPFRSWDMGRDGIYYVDAKPKPTLKLFRFRDRKTLVVADVPQPPQRSERGLSVAPDGSVILYLQLDSVRNEILVAQMP
jgi:eukaryotic-like serine/threonine-protein kinase